jgi:3-oxoadipate enol-lactonase
MKNLPRIIRVGEIDFEIDIADYTTPWNPQEPETIFFHNGNSRQMEFWRPLVADLAKYYRVVRFNSRGLGATTRPAEDSRYDTNLLVDDAISVLDALELDQVHWVGESSGGVFGMVAALRYPKRLKSLTLINAPFKFPDVATKTYNLDQPDHASAIKKYGVGEWSRRTLGFRLDLRLASQELQDWYVSEMDKVPQKVAIDHHLLTVDADLCKSVSGIHIPVLNMVGEHSPLAEQSQMREMQRVLPNVRLEIFKGYGHGINVLAPDQCVRTLSDFLSQNGFKSKPR